MIKKKLKYLFYILLSILLIQFFGLHTHLFERNFDEFDYPLSENIYPYVEQMRNNDKPSVDPINFYNYSFLTTCEKKCQSNIRLLLIIKSALGNSDRRAAIRNSWGYETRFSDVAIRRVFILGVGDGSQHVLQESIDAESKEFQDIVQADFYDTYFNNTIKTMMGFTWAIRFCSKAKYYMFIDDDMYVSIKNVLRFTRNPSHYPEYVEESLAAIMKVNLERNRLKPVAKGSNSLVGQTHEDKMLLKHQEFHVGRQKRQAVHVDFELPDDAILYTGFVFNSSPHRHVTSKWYISLEEYPWHRWPPYVSAGAYILSHEALVLMYYASHFTKHFRFDDIYVGILAKKMGIEPFHCKEVYFYKKDYNVHSYRFVIASHGYDNPQELLAVWNEQRSAGNA